MSIVFDKADKNDINELIRMRIAYMADDFGSVSDIEKESMEKQLPDYFERKLGTELIAFVARAEGRLVADGAPREIFSSEEEYFGDGFYGW